jgi:hypothetical protein
MRIFRDGQLRQTDVKRESRKHDNVTFVMGILNNLLRSRSHKFHPHDIHLPPSHYDPKKCSFPDLIPMLESFHNLCQK